MTEAAHKEFSKLYEAGWEHEWYQAPLELHKRQCKWAARKDLV